MGTDAEMLARLLAMRVEEVRGSGGGEALKTVAQHIVKMLEKQQKTSMEENKQLVEYLQRAESFIPKTKQNNKDSPLLELINTALNLAIVEDPEDIEDEDDPETPQGPSSLANTGGLAQLGRNRTTSLENATKADLSRTSPAIFTNLP